MVVKNIRIFLTGFEMLIGTQIASGGPGTLFESFENKIIILERLVVCTL